MSTPAELAPDYYLTNFRALVDFVMAHYESLLSAEERAFYRTFTTLDLHSQRLYVRLLSRKGVASPAGALFRQGKLAYAEITDLVGRIDTLIQAGLLQRNPLLPLADILPLYTKHELQACSPIALPKTVTRPALVQALLEQGDSANQSLQIRQALLASDSFLALKQARHFDTFKLCFFGNLHQDLTDYVLRDLGLYRYEPYPLDRTGLPFQSRRQIDQHLQYYQCLERLDTVLAADTDDMLALAADLPEADNHDATLQRRLNRLRLTLARQLERLEAWRAADSLYRACATPPARERRARIAVKQGDTQRALAICRDILSAPHNEAERVFAQSFGYRTARKAGCEGDWSAPVKLSPPAHTVSLPRQPQRVELVAATYLENQGLSGQCFYVENALFNGVLGLFTWDILFAPVPGAFFNPFQVAPSDFRTADFYRSRQSLFEDRLKALEGSLEERVWHHYHAKQGIANPLVAWEALPETLLQLALERIPHEHWRQLFGRLLDDIQHHRNGLPDLIFFPAEGGYELVEVKGPGDRLQDNQQRWLAFFAEQQIPHQVLHVEWQA